jgi:hypothetical protein
MQMVRTAVMAIAIYPFTVRFGIAGAGVTVVLSILAMILVWYPSAQRILKTSWGRYVSAVGPPLVSAGFMVGIVWVLLGRWSLSQMSLFHAISVFVCMSLVGLLGYVTALWAFQKRFHNLGVFDDFRNMYGSLRKK